MFMGSTHRVSARMGQEHDGANIEEDVARGHHCQVDQAGGA